MTHTPGPWFYLGGLVYSAEKHGASWTRTIAHVVSTSPTADGELMAAAPRMRAALGRVVFEASHDQDCARREHTANECTCFKAAAMEAFAAAGGQT